jgi:tight adherence protein B
MLNLMSPQVVSLVVAATVLMGCLAVYNLLLYWQRRGRVGGRVSRLAAEAEERELYRRSVLLQFGERLDRTGWGKRMQQRLSQADLPIRSSEYVAALVLLGIVTYYVVQMLFELGFVYNLVITIAVVVIIPRYFLRIRRGHYVTSFNRQMSEIATLISNSLRAGLSIPQAFRVVADKMSRPAGVEFSTTDRELRMGVDVEAAMRRMLARLPSEELRMMITTITIQRLAGGNLAEALAVMSSAITARRKLMEEINAMTAEARYTGVLLVILPIITLALVNRMMPGSVARFLSHPIGWVIMIIYVIVQAVAFILVRRISDIKV